MIHLIPSMSIIDGKITRIAQGDFRKGIVYDDNPIDLALKFQDTGIQLIHIVDLDGTLKGSPQNYHVLQSVAGYTDLKINFSGGIYTDGDVNKALEHGAASITAGTVAVNNPEQFSNWIFSYGRDKIALSADSIEGKISIQGWQRDTNIDMLDHVGSYYDKSLRFAKVTDIMRDGTMIGPNFEMYESIIRRFPNLSVFASGGIRSMDDVRRLEDIGVYGVIFGKAFYENKIGLKDLEAFINSVEY